MFTDGLGSSVLVLNISYEVINVCSARRAIVLILKGVATAEESTDKIFRSTSLTLRVPAVIRLMRYVKISYKLVTFSRKNIFLRDNYTCYYCMKQFKPRELTLDHVIPRSKGGWNNWDNVVTACILCNKKKGNKTPEEADLILMRRPKAPALPTYLQIIKNIGLAKKEWRKYLFLEA
jgi:5-methylcytosine-specific restriction endonuclease McrA